MTKTHTGVCFCGAVEVEASGEPVAMGYCHCASCRHHSGAPLSTFVLFPSDKVRVTRGESKLRTYSKTGASHRRFCTECGGHILVDLQGAGLTDVYAPALRNFAFEAQSHVNYGEKVLSVRDGLPKFRDFPAEAGGSGELLPD